MKSSKTMLLLFALGFSVAGAEFYYNGFGTLAFNVAGFGTEYGNTAASLVRGNGFSNPFGFETGPSSWVPPGVVVVYALVFKIFGIKTYSAALALLFIRAVALTAAVWSLVRAAQLVDPERRSAPTIIGLSALALFGHFHWLSQRCTDQWMIILASALAILFLEQMEAQGVRPWHFVYCLLLPLTVPAIGLGVGVILLGRIRQHPRQVLPLLLAFLFSAGTWTARNLAVMDAPFLIKSNLGVEFHLSNPSSPSGLLTSEVHLNHHPLHPNNIESQEIQQLGESEFCRRYRDKAVDYIREQPGQFVTRVYYRGVNAFVFSQFSGPADIWLKVRGIVYAFVPFALLGLGLIRGDWRIPTFRHILVLYLSYFLPYVLVSHYERYQLAALGLQTWIVWLTLFSRRVSSEPTPPTENKPTSP